MGNQSILIICSFIAKVKIRYRPIVPSSFRLFPIKKQCYSLQYVFAKRTNKELKNKNLKLFRSALLSYLCRADDGRRDTLAGLYPQRAAAVRLSLLFVYILHS